MRTDVGGRSDLDRGRREAVAQKDMPVDPAMAEMIMFQMASAASGISHAANMNFATMLWTAHLFWNMAETREEAHERLRQFSELTAEHIDRLYDHEIGGVTRN